MISGVSASKARNGAAHAAGSVPGRWPAVLAGMAGCLLLVAATSPEAFAGQVPVFDMGIVKASSPSTLQGWLFLVAPVLATGLGLVLLRWWPYLLAAAGLMAVPGLMAQWNPNVAYPWVIVLLPAVGYALTIVALLACAQGLVRTSMGWGAAVAALALGSRLIGWVITDGSGWQLYVSIASSWHAGLLAVGLAVLAPAAWLYRRGDPEAAGLASDRSWQRFRLVIAGTLAVSVSIPLAFLTTQRLADLLGVSWDSLYRHGVAETAVIGAITVVAVTLLAALAGRWSLAATITVAVALAAVTVPVILTLGALGNNDPLLWLAALASVAVGGAVAGTRWRVQLAATLAVLAAVALLIAYGATTGGLEKLTGEHVVIPSVLILVLCVAAAGAVAGASAPVLADRGALPAVLGPLAGALTVGGIQVTQVTTLSDGEPLPSFLNQQTTSAILLLVAAAAIAGLGFAQLLATRRAERKQAEQIRREAATAERDRLGRSIHDGVLQVLSLVQRQGSELGARGSELAALAGEQEVALRGLLAGQASTGGAAGEDVRGPLQALAGPAVQVATPAQAVKLPSAITAEVVAAVRAALDNVRKHAGADAQTSILLEDEQDGVRVTVRDNGVGFPPGRPAEAAAAGRLGIAQSMRGRIADCGGTTTISSRPGRGTEVEFWIPRPPRARS
jgi:signal transduction histidine kinase